MTTENFGCSIDHGLHIFGFPGGNKKSFVGVGQYGIEHCQAGSGDINIIGLYKQTAVGMIIIIGMEKLGDIDIIQDRTVTFGAISIGNGGAAIGGSRNNIVAADHNVMFGVSGIKSESGGSFSYPIHQLIFGEVSNIVFYANTMVF